MKDDYRDALAAAQARVESLKEELSAAEARANALKSPEAPIAPAIPSTPPARGRFGWTRWGVGGLVVLLFVVLLFVAYMVASHVAVRDVALSQGAVGTGEVIAVSGDAPVRVEHKCNVTVEPTNVSLNVHLWSLQNCRIKVTCNDKTLYGEGILGFTRCTRDSNGGPVEAHDHLGTRDEGDPLLDLDLAHRRIRVADDAPKAFTVDIALAPP